MNILQENVCNLPDCDCGWNVIISGKDKKELKLLVEKLGEIGVEKPVEGKEDK